MIQSIKDFWPNLFGERESQQSEENQDDQDEEEYKKVLAQEMVPEEQQIGENFKNLWWSRVIATIDFREDMDCKYSMETDALDGLQQMKEIDI